MLPEKIRQLDVSIGASATPQGQLIKRSVYEFRYLDPRPDQTSMALLMPASAQATWQDVDLFPVMDQHLPEGDLFMRLRAMFPKQPLTPMHLLALVGSNGIGRLGYQLPGAAPAPAAPAIDRATLLKTRYTPEVFDELVHAYLSTGAGISGLQPKIMVPDRPTVPVPSLIVKAASPAYPGLAANEYLCLKAAQRAGIATPNFELSDDGQMLVLDRFDLVTKEDGTTERLGFEDIAALAGLRVRDVLSDRKYQGSYQRYAGGPELEDRTLALKLFAGKHGSKAYPTTEDLLQFGLRICELSSARDVLQRIAEAQDAVLTASKADTRIPSELHAQIAAAWQSGMAYATGRAR